MTLLTLVQQVSNEIGLAQPSQVVGSADTTVRQLLALAQREGRELSRRYDWTPLQTEYTFTLANGVPAYAFPADFDRLINRTEWDRLNKWELYGPLSPQEWQWRKSGITVTSPRRRFRVKGSSSTMLYIDPTPGAGDVGATMVFEYISANWCKSAGSVGQSAWAADTDTGILVEDLMVMGIKWRFLNAKGMAYDEAFREYQYACDRTAAQEGGSPSLSLTRRGVNAIGIAPASVPETGFGS